MEVIGLIAQVQMDLMNLLTKRNKKTSCLSREFPENGSLAVKKRPFVGDKRRSRIFLEFDAG